MDTIRLGRLVISDYKLLREPTEEEMSMIKNGEIQQVIMIGVEFDLRVLFLYQKIQFSDIIP